MSHFHKLDKAKVEKSLNDKGWKRGIYKEWIAPLGSNPAQFELDWYEAILDGIECAFEESRKATIAKLAENPTPKRS